MDNSTPGRKEDDALTGSVGKGTKRFPNLIIWVMMVVLPVSAGALRFYNSGEMGLRYPDEFIYTTAVNIINLFSAERFSFLGIEGINRNNAPPVLVPKETLRERKGTDRSSLSGLQPKDPQPC